MQLTTGSAMGADAKLCLDFSDSVDWRTSDHAKDQLVSYAKLLEWSREHGILDAKQEAALSRGTSEAESARVMADAFRLRDSIYRMFSAIAHKRKADPDDLGILNQYLTRGLPRLRVAEGGDSYAWDWGGPTSPDMMLYPIAASAAGLLTSGNLGKVRECANEEEGCGWLFLDHSKSQTRRWCSMEGCGNRMKFRTYYDKHIRAKQSRRS
jgi:predicted RNA-binding Zn ribbon-like protein